MINFYVSVIIPVYNAEKTLGRAINSVLLHNEITELVLVEDGSVDNSYALCLHEQKRDNRIIVLQHQGGQNKGVSASRNLGIKNCKNEFIAFLDADDYYLPNRFEQTIKSFITNPEADGIYEMTGLINEDGVISSYSQIGLVNAENLFENLQPLGEKVWFHCNGLTVKKTIFEKCGFFEEKIKTSEDTLQWFKMALTAKLLPGNIDRPVVLAVKTFGSLSSDKVRVNKDFVTMLCKLFGFCKYANCTKERKELVLAKLFFFWLQSSFNFQDKATQLLSVFTADPSFVLFRSKSFRLHAGNFIGVNRLRFFVSRNRKNSF